MRRRTTVALALTMAGALALAACSSDSDTDGGSTDATTTTAKAAPLQILVTNDDGYSAPGIDALVQALRTLPDVEIAVVAPATNQSGTGDKTTPGTLTATSGTTASGYPATAVQGYPADSVNYALDTLKLKPDIVVSGSNFGQNIGPAVPISGTVGAARTAVRRGIPAVAVSQQVVGTPDFAPSVGYALDWVKQNRAALAKGKSALVVINLNATACSPSRGIKTAPVATSGDITNVACTGTPQGTPSDVAWFTVGYATASTVNTDAGNVTTTTTFPTK